MITKSVVKGISTITGELPLLFNSIIVIILMTISPCCLADPLQKMENIFGQLVDIGTHKLHINCQGDKSPTIIIDSGLGGFSLEWVNLQKELSKTSRVCTYDRAGYGWSESGPLPRTTEQIAKELHLLLILAKVPGPYILVGHSFGGYNIRYYASKYPEMIAGLIFIDSSHPEQYNRMPRPEIKAATIKGIRIKLAYPVLSSNFPEKYKQQAYMLMSNYKARHTQINELENFNLSAKQVMANNHLPNVPITVVTRGKRVWPENDFGDRAEQTWFELQSELINLSDDSTQIFAHESGHAIHLDEPVVVYEAISTTVNKSHLISDFNMKYEKSREVIHQNLVTMRFENIDNLPLFVYNQSIKPVTEITYFLNLQSDIF